MLKCLLKVRENAQTITILLLNNFEKIHKTTFLTQKKGQKRPAKYAKMRKYLTESIFCFIYQPFKLKIHTKVSLQGLKHCLNTSNTTPKQL